MPSSNGGGHKPLDHYSSLAEIPKPELSVGEILREAQTRWLRPLEVYDILSHYQEYHFQLNKEAPVLPKSGQLYMFDRKEVRYFRKDGHVWTKKKDGKAVQEAHEKLKLGSLEILHCYYAHSEKDDLFQRRCYWMLDEARERIVLVHYLRVTESHGHHAEPTLPARKALHPHSVKRHTSSSPCESSQGSESEEERASPDAVLVSHRPRKVQAKRHSFSGGHKGTKRHAEDAEQSLPPRPESTAVQSSSFRAPKSEPASDGSSQGTSAKMSRHGSGANGAHGLVQQGSQDLTGIVIDTPGKLEQAVLDAFSMDVDVSRGEGAMLDSLPAAAPPPWQEWQTEKAPSSQAFSWETAGPVTTWAAPAEPLPAEGTFPWEVKEEVWQGGVQQQLWSAPSWGSAPAAIPSLDNESDRGLWLKEKDTSASQPVLASSMGPAETPAQFGMQTPSGDWSASWGTGQAASLDLPRPWQESPQTQWVSTEPIPVKADLWVPTLPQAPPPASHSASDPVPPPLGKPPLAPTLPKLRQLKGLRTLSVPGMSSEGTATPGVGIGSPFAVPESPTVVQVLREMHSDAGSRPSSAAPIPEEVEGDGLEESKDEDTAMEEDFQKQRGQHRGEERQGGHVRTGSYHLPRFEILDCSPEWDFSVGGAKVLIVGNWQLPDGQTCSSVDDFRASITFGGVDVPAEPVGSSLRCTAPAHMPGRVPLCVSLGENQPCSEVREFEYRPSPVAYTSRRTLGGPLAVEDTVDEDDDAALQVRLARLLLGGGSEKESEEWEELLRTERASGCVEDGLLQRVLRHELDLWLAKAAQTEPYGAYAAFDGSANSLTALNDVGLSALHMSASLGYEWAVASIVDAGCPVDLKDARGRTALHWAAARGREQVVAQLLTHGAAPGMLATKGGCTPADLAATCGHTGIAAFLAECALNRSLSNMTINDDMAAASDAAEAGAKAVAVATSTQGMHRGTDAGLENALEAVRNAARAAALIQSAYRRRRQRQLRMQQEGGQGLQPRSEFANEGQQQKEETEHLAAKRIQGAFRSFADRREFLSFKQKVVRLQAAVRGHLQRKRYRRMRAASQLDEGAYIWPMHNMDKRPRPASYHVDEEEILPLPSPAVETVGEEWRNVGGTDSKYALERAVTRVQAMVRSRQARAQYLRLRQAAQSMQVEHWQHQHGMMQEHQMQYTEPQEAFDPSVYLI